MPVLSGRPNHTLLTRFEEPYPRKLHGRFLHITDIHPDPFYEPGASALSACHRTSLKDNPPAGYYGTPFRYVNVPVSDPLANVHLCPVNAIRPSDFQILP